MIEFWRKWKRLSEIEEKAIKAIRKAKRILLSEIGKEHINAIYAKGSFVRREMNDKSDVDLVPIVYENKFLNKILMLDTQRGKEYRPAELLPLSIWEIKNKKRYYARKEKGPRGRPSIDEFERYELLWGTPLNPAEFVPRESKDRLRGMVHAFNEIFFPLYEQKKFSFGQVVKQVFSERTN